jgi:hypothetical protein
MTGTLARLRFSLGAVGRLRNTLRPIRTIGSLASPPSTVTDSASPARRPTRERHGCAALLPDLTPQLCRKRLMNTHVIGFDADVTQRSIAPLLELLRSHNRLRAFSITEINLVSSHV